MNQLPITKDIVYLSYPTNNSKFSKVIMIPIDNSLENKIDKKLNLNITVRNCNYFISPDKVLAYGNIDLEDPNDLDMIDHLNLNIDNFTGVILPSHYDYETHSIRSRKYFQTWDNELIFRFKYAQLGKPEKILIFKQ